jgi:hypothetical protein
VTSYAVRNSIDAGTSSSPNTPTTKTGFGPLPSIPSSEPVEGLSSPGPLTPSAEADGAPPPTASRASTRAPLSRRGSAALSRILNKTAPAEPGGATFAAFKALPVDPARARQDGGDGADDLAAAATCAEAVDVVVAAIAAACADVGTSQDGFVKAEDVVRSVLTSIDSSENANSSCSSAWRTHRG